MPVKFPMSARYPNYHQIAIHTANLYSSQTCLNENDDCGGNQMHCRAIVYHPAAVYIPHTHTPSYHNASSGTSLLPTPPSVSQPIYDSATKGQSFNSRDYAKSGPTNGPNTGYSKSQGHGIALSSHQGPFIKAQTLGNSQSYKHSNVDGSYKYSSPAIAASRFPVQYNRRTAAGSAVGSPACIAAQKSDYSGSQASQRSGYHHFASNLVTGSSYSGSKMFNANNSFEYVNGRRNHSNDRSVFRRQRDEIEQLLGS